MTNIDWGAESDDTLLEVQDDLRYTRGRLGTPTGHIYDRILSDISTELFRRAELEQYRND